MIINGTHLFEAAPIKNMLATKERSHGVSYGLAEAGYDIRIAQTVKFGMHPDISKPRTVDVIYEPPQQCVYKIGRFALASAIEEFDMPNDLVGVVHDKSTWARRGLSVFNTVIEPGWKGFLTLELVYHGEGVLEIPRGAGIAQVLFSRVAVDAAYSGKYQNQPNRPTGAIHED